MGGQRSTLKPRAGRVRPGTCSYRSGVAVTEDVTGDVIAGVGAASAGWEGRQRQPLEDGRAGALVLCIILIIA